MNRFPVRSGYYLSNIQKFGLVGFLSLNRNEPNREHPYWTLPPTTPEPNSVFGQELRLETLSFLSKVLGLALQLDPTLLGLVAKLSPKHFQQVSIALGPAITLEGGVPLLCFFFLSRIAVGSVVFFAKSFWILLGSWTQRLGSC